MSRIEFPVEVRIVHNADTGESFYLPTEKDFDEEYALAKADLEQTLAARLEAGDNPASHDKQRKTFEINYKADLTRRRKERDAVLSLATTYKYALVKPTHGELTRIKGEAQVLDHDTGRTRWDEDRYRQLLLSNDGVKKNGKILSADELDELDPLLAEILGFRLARSIKPDSRRMLFISPLSEVTSPLT